MLVKGYILLREEVSIVYKINFVLEKIIYGSLFLVLFLISIVILGDLVIF